MLFSVYYNGESKKGNMSPKHRRTLTPTPASFQRDTDCCTPGRQAKRQKCGTSNSVVKRNKAGASYFLPTLCQFSFVYSNKGMNSPCIQRDTDCCTPVDWQRVKGLKTYGPCPLSRPHFCLKYQAVYNSHQTGLTLIQFH